MDETLQEIPISKYLEKMEKTIDRFEQKLDKNNETTEKTLIQATKTNGRANALEQFAEDTKKAIEALVKSNELHAVEISTMREKHRSDARSVRWMVGIVAFFIVGFAVMLQENIKSYNEKLITNQIQASTQKN